MRRFPRLTFRYDTVYSSKGKGADYVIVLDVNDGQQGWASQNQDDPLLQLVLADKEAYLFAKGWWLFYVAVTRTRYHPYVLSGICALSVFVKELLDGCHTEDECHHIVTGDGMQEQAAVIRCPSCDGLFERKTSPFGEFYRCRNYPYCEERGDDASSVARGRSGARCMPTSAPIRLTGTSSVSIHGLEKVRYRRERGSMAPSLAAQTSMRTLEVH